MFFKKSVNLKNVLAILILIASLIQILLSLEKASFVDFYAYWGVGNAYLKGFNPYSQYYINPSGLLNFIYPPGAAIIFIPLSIIPINLSIKLFTICSILSFIAAIWLCFYLIKLNLNLDSKLIILAFLMQTQAFKITLALGQINNILLFLIILSLYLYNKNKSIASAIIFSSSVTLKLIPIALFPLFILKRNYIFLLYSVIFLLFLNFLTPQYLFSYIDVVFKKYWPVFQSSSIIQNQSFSTLIFRLTNLQNSPLMAYFISFFLYIFILFFMNKTNLFKKCFLILAISSISQYVSWQHHLVLAIPLLILIAKYNYFLFFLFWISYFINLNIIGKFSSPTSILFSYQTISTLILILLFIYRENLNSINRKLKISTKLF